MKKIAILGSTGSIGQNSLDVISRFPDKFSVSGLSAYSNVHLLERQAKRFKPRIVALNRDNIVDLSGRLNSGIKIFDLEQGIKNIISQKETDLIILAISGSAALLPLWEAVKQGKTIALANKEALVIAGLIIMKKAKETGARIIPVDSEQSAIFQCLNGRDKKSIKRIYLTASGGPLKSVPKNKFSKLSSKDVLKHPRWKMGRKITVDSATLMNKGLEILEAMYLFDLEPGQIEVIIHKEAIIHSMVEFIDGSILAQLGATDMRLPIQYALTFPQRWFNNLRDIDFIKLRQLSFEKPDFRKFPCLSLAYQAARQGGSIPCVLNAANEISVNAFLNGRLRFDRIFPVIDKVLTSHNKIKEPDLQEIIAIDKWAREKTLTTINNLR
jgi:1-deoxy-D-xylulose-5-phosphate reductoisomerase